MSKPQKFVGLSISDSYVEYLEKTLNSVVTIVDIAESWSEDQINGMTDGSICISAMKDIRRITKEQKEK